MSESGKYRVVVSPRARQMLVSSAAFLAKVSKDAALQLVNSFEQAALSLEAMPKRRPWLIGEFLPRNTYRYLLFEKRYMMIYQIKDDTVLIEYVIDCRQDYDWLII